ncbi:MAG: hypothetical protein AB7K09_12735 [Planctomycetota bacterium]
MTMTTTRKTVRTGALMLLALLMLAVVAPHSGPAQDPRSATFPLQLRDGTTLELRNADYNATGVTGEDVNLSGVTLRVPWAYVAPMQAMHLRSVLIGDNATVAQRMELINWARTFEELGDGVRTQLQAVLRADPRHAEANRIARQLGLVMRDGVLQRDAGNDSGDPGANANRNTPGNGNVPGNGNGGANGDPASNNANGGQPVRPAGPIKITLAVKTEIIWSGQYERYKREPGTSCDDLMKRFFQQRDFRIVTTGADFAVEIFITAKPDSISEFFDLPVAAQFSGTAAANVTDRRVGGSGTKKDIPAVNSKVQRTDIEAALDGVLADLAERIGAPAASACR